MATLDVTWRREQAFLDGGEVPGPPVRTRNDSTSGEARRRFRFSGFREIIG